MNQAQAAMLTPSWPARSRADKGRIHDRPSRFRPCIRGKVHTCATTGSGAIAWEKRLRRAAFIKFLEDEAPRCLVGMEACGSAHHWARWLAARGFTVKLMAPKAVRAYRAGVHKSDRRDARAVAEATSRSQVTAVRVKSTAAQATQPLMRVRERRIRQRVQTTNQLRGLLNEFGIVLPK